MKAAVFHKIGDIQIDSVNDPGIEQSRDAIIRITSTAIGGSDLHIYGGFIPQLKNEVLGHEFMCIVEDVSSKVTNLKKGNRVPPALLSLIQSTIAQKKPDASTT